MLVLVALAACQQAPNNAISPERLPPSINPADPAESQVKEAVLRAYRGMWQDFASAARTADWNAAELRDHATGDALLILRHGLWLAHRNGEVIKGQPVLDPRITSLVPMPSPTKAKITDCVDDTDFRLRGKSSKPGKEDWPAGRHKTTAELSLRKDAWYVTAFVLREAGTC
ncbi:hypothetical protein ABGB17_17370 [Sphaerisporangium sp. B11E5]|uniref:hypothetical protein n=1 Tax=Sphaerisporangium sp. B11E5 TaxID=3153563 RepID=UPI00325F1BCD